MSNLSTTIVMGLGFRVIIIITIITIITTIISTITTTISGTQGLGFNPDPSFKNHASRNRDCSRDPNIQALHRKGFIK